jgi:hypothetical protein
MSFLCGKNKIRNNKCSFCGHTFDPAEVNQQTEDRHQQIERERIKVEMDGKSAPSARMN